MHPNQSMKRDKELLRSSLGEELSKEIEGLKEDQENSLFKQLLKLDQISYTN
jgi:hypothetical protein